MFYRVEQRDTEVLDDAVESHELEHAEGRDERSSALSSQRKGDGGYESLGAQLECISAHFFFKIWSSPNDLWCLPDEGGDAGNVWGGGGEG